MSKANQTRLEKYLAFIANHRVLSGILFFGVCVAALAAFTENISKLSEAGIRLFEHHSEKPQLEARLMSRIGGFEIRIANPSDTLVTQVFVDVVTWGIGAPGPFVRQSMPVRDLPPHSDVTLEMGTLRGNQGEHQESNNMQGSGYIVVTWGNSDYPRAWAFCLPGQRDEDKLPEVMARQFRGNDWPIVEFKYPTNTPPIGCGVNYPKGVCERYDAWNLPVTN